MGEHSWWLLSFLRALATHRESERELPAGTCNPMEKERLGASETGSSGCRNLEDGTAKPAQHAKLLSLPNDNAHANMTIGPHLHGKNDASGYVIARVLFSEDRKNYRKWYN